MSDKVLVSVKNLFSGYENINVLEDITFELKMNEVVGLLGTNGCGKTTLIKSLCKIIPSKGEILVDDTDVSTWSSKVFAKNCSLVPQKSGIGIDITVLDVVLMGFNPFLSLIEKPTNIMISKSVEILKMFGLESRRFDNFQSLSEGQKQLVIIARALVANTSVLYMDEPENSLDFSVRYDMMSILRKQIVGLDKCALVSLHDINLALDFCDKLLLIKDGKLSSTVDVLHEDKNSIEHKLQDIYGSIKLVSIADEDGKESLIMVKA